MAAESSQIGDSEGHRGPMSASFHCVFIVRPRSFKAVRGHVPTSIDQGSRTIALVKNGLGYLAKVGVAGSNPVVRSNSAVLRHTAAVATWRMATGAH